VPVVVDLDADPVALVHQVVSDWPAEVLGHAMVACSGLVAVLILVRCMYRSCAVCIR
jgi:hypothetical protein